VKRLALITFLLAACILIQSFGRYARGDTASPGCPPPCEAGKQCELVISLPYEAEQAVLSATKSLAIGDGATVVALDGADGAVANLGQVSTSVGNQASVGGVFSNADVTLGAGATVNGPLQTGGTLLNPAAAVVKGKVTTSTPIHADRHILAKVTFSTAATNVDVVDGATRNLQPGNYGDVRVGAGGTLSLSAGTYDVRSLTVLPEATLNLDETAGAVVVYIESGFAYAGKETQLGGDGHVLIAVFGCAPVILTAPFRGTVTAQNASLSLRAVNGETFAGKYFAESIDVGPKITVAGLTTALPSGPPSLVSSPAPLLPPLPAPPPPTVGCYVHNESGWQSVPCATDAFIRQHFPHPDAQLTLSPPTPPPPPPPPLVFGQLAVRILSVASETNAFQNPNCTSGSPTPNQWSVQNNTNSWSVPKTAAAGAGDTALVQFMIQSDGTTNGICIWNVDASSPQKYSATCNSPGTSQ
jgi:hypothetical protein